MPTSSMPTSNMSPRDLAADQLKRQRGRSIAIALSLGMLVVLFYAATMVHMSKNLAPATPAATSDGKRPG